MELEKVKQLETLREYVYQEFSVRFPLPVCLCALLQQNLVVVMVIAIIAITHRELATKSSPCLRFSTCFFSVPWT